MTHKRDPLKFSYSSLRSHYSTTVHPPSPPANTVTHRPLSEMMTPLNHLISISSSFLEPVLLALVEKIRLGATQVDDLRTPVSILLQHRALLAVVGVRDPRAPAYDASPLVRSVVALIADAH